MIKSTEFKFFSFVEGMYFVCWSITMLWTRELKASIFSSIGYHISPFNSLRILQLEDYSAVKLFVFSAIIIFVGIFGSAKSFKNRYSELSEILSFLSLILNIVFSIVLIIYLANPILTAIFFVTMAAGFLESTSK